MRDDVFSAFADGMTDAQRDAVPGVMGDSALREGLRKRLIAEMAARKQAAATPESDILKIYAQRLQVLPATYASLPDSLAVVFSRGQDRSALGGAVRWFG